MNDNQSNPAGNRTTALGVGVLLVGLGVLFLLQNLGLFGNLRDLIWLVLFAAGGVAFLFVFATNLERWWAVIPGFVLLGLALLVGFGDRLGTWGGALFLGSIGLAFWVIYLVRRDFWWAIIPGGVLMTLAVVAALSDSLPDLATGGVFFLGLAATFVLVYLLPAAEDRQRWAVIPALVLGIMGLLLTLQLGRIINFVWAGGLVAAGVYLLLRSRTSQR